MPVRRGRQAIFALALALQATASFPGLAEEVAHPPTAECSDRAVQAVQSRYEGIRDVTARFEQTSRQVTTGVPGQPLVSRGKVVLAKPGKMRWTYEEPEPSLVVSDGKTLWLFDPAFGEVQKIPAGEGFLTGAAAQFLLGAGDMRRDFAVSAVSCDASEAELELVPRESATYERAFLRVDPSTGEVRSTRIVDLLGNVVRIDFRDLRFNTSPRESEFRFQVPEGVKVIELDP
jgi:outer membrane lipoprotein carrier protein